GTLKWDADIGFRELSISKAIGGAMVSDASGTIKADQSAAIITADARLNGVASKISMTEPIDLSGAARKQQNITLIIDDKSRNKLFPGLDAIFSGPMTVELGMLVGKKRLVSVDLRKTRVYLTWVCWQKGAGIPATLNFQLVENEMKDSYDVQELVLTGETFGAKGSLSIVNGSLNTANLTDVRLNRADRLSLKAAKSAGGYRVTVKGAAFDARALIKQITKLDQI